jgi:PAS domain S-box-containing protein
MDPDSHVGGAPVVEESTSELRRRIAELERQVRSLRRQERSSRLLSDVAGEGLLVIQDDRVVDCNSRALEMFGCDREQLQDPDREQHPAGPRPDGQTTVDSVRSQILEAIAAGKDKLEWQIRRPDGGSFEAEVTLLQVKADGQSQVIAICRDVTADRAAEANRERLLQSLVSTSALHESVLNAIPDIIGVQDREHRILRYNDAGYRFVGRSPGEANGRRCFELLGRRDACTTCVTTRAIESGKMAQQEMFIEEMDTWFEVRAYPVLDEQGAVVQVIEHLRDITQRKATQSALRESEEKYHIVVDESLEGIYIAQKRVIQFCNRQFARLFGFESPDAAVGQTLRSMVSPESWGAVDEQLRLREIGAKTVSHYRFVARRQDGTHFDAESLSTVIDYRGHPAIHGVIRDVSEEERLKRQLFQAQKMESIGRLAGGVAHDFNNLLTTIIGNCELAMEGLVPGDPLLGDLEEINHSAQRASELTRQLLALSRKQVLEPRVINLNTVLANMEKVLRRLIGEDILLQTLIQRPDLWMTRVDPGQMEQVILNLVVNARDAMPRGGRLVIETDNVQVGEREQSRHPEFTTGQYVMLSISDTGSGMPEEVQAQVFEPFFTTKERGKGTGLGLSTVYGIVKQSGGYIYVYSEPEVGTVIKIYLPRARGREETLDPHRQAEAIPRGDETILLVEDELTVMVMASKILKKQGYHVIEANSPGDALLECDRREDPVDLVVTDVIMPKMNGPILVERIRSRWPGVKVLFMSGYTPAYIFTEGVVNPRMPYIQKPFRPATFCIRVREVLDS